MSTGLVIGISLVMVATYISCLHLSNRSYNLILYMIAGTIPILLFFIIDTNVTNILFPLDSSRPEHEQESSLKWLLWSHVFSMYAHLIVGLLVWSKNEKNKKFAAT